MRITATERVLGVLGYLAFLFIIPVKAKRDSMFVQFHARQGGVLFMLWFVAALVLGILLLFVDEIELLSQFVLALILLATLAYLVMALIGIFKVVLGERYRMPVVADVALKMGL